MGEFNIKYNLFLYSYSTSNRSRYGNCILKANIRYASWKALEIVLPSKEVVLNNEF